MEKFSFGANAKIAEPVERNRLRLEHHVKRFSRFDLLGENQIEPDPFPPFPPFLLSSIQNSLLLNAFTLVLMERF